MWTRWRREKYLALSGIEPCAFSQESRVDRLSRLVNLKRHKRQRQIVLAPKAMNLQANFCAVLSKDMTPARSISHRHYERESHAETDNSPDDTSILIFAFTTQRVRRSQDNPSVTAILNGGGGGLAFTPGPLVLHCQSFYC